jgi:uncharacterized OB-fold protein
VSTGAYLPEGLAIPVPEPDGLSAPYWEGLRRNQLLVQRCTSCGNWQWGPEWLCHKCHSFDMAWTAVEGRGELYSWTRVYHPVHPALKDRGPYLIAVVELPHAGRIRMLGNLLGDAMQEPAFGSAVQVEFEHHETASPPYSLAQWRLAADG